MKNKLTTFDTILPKTQEYIRILGENLKLARLRRRLPQSIVADRASISRQTLSKLENGDCKISIGVLANVLHALNDSDKELTNIMREDELGRTIQDLNIKVPRRGRR